MTKYQLNRPDGPWDYPTFGFRAAGGAILDGTLFDPPIVNPPDRHWSVYAGGSAQTGVTLIAYNGTPTVSPPTPENYLPLYRRGTGTFIPTAPAEVFALPDVAAGFAGAVADQIEDPTSDIGSRLAASYVGEGVSVFVVSGLTFGTTATTTIADANYAAIMEAVSAASVAGGVVDIPAGFIYIGGHYLPFVDGVFYRAVQPGQKQTVTGGPSYAANFHWEWTDLGTVLLGDGSGNCFWDGQSDSPTLPDDIDATSTKLCGILGGIGIDGFETGIRAGGRNRMGLTYATFGRIYIMNVSKAVHMVNYQELQWDYLVSKARDGQYWGSDIAPFVPGNSHVGTFYHMIPSTEEAAAGGFDLRDCRGIVFEAKQGDGLNQMLIDRIQSTAYNVTELSVTATCVAGSTSITVPNGSKFKPGMIVRTVADAVFNGTDNRAYIVKTVSGNLITLAYSLGQSPIAASGNGSVSLTTRGFACLEVVGRDASYCTAFRVNQIDVEGERIGVYTERILGGSLNLDQTPASTFTSMVARNCTMTVNSTSDMTDNLDTNTAVQSVFTGWRAGSEWNRGKGIWFNSVAGRVEIAATAV